MTKSEKKVQLNTMIAEFLKTADPAELTRIRDGIFKEVSKLPMSTHDRNHTEDEMDLWTYNTDRYIQNPKSTAAHTSVVADFEAIVKTVDASLLGN
jgi:hypothetical protein